MHCGIDEVKNRPIVVDSRWNRGDFESPKFRFEFPKIASMSQEGPGIPHRDRRIRVATIT
jgi:hypothetical protein